MPAYFNFSALPLLSSHLGLCPRQQIAHCQYVPDEPGELTGVGAGTALGPSGEDEQGDKEKGNVMSQGLSSRMLFAHVLSSKKR